MAGVLIYEHTQAEYGKRIVSTLSAQLEKEYGRNFTEKNVRRMMKFAGQFQELEIVIPLARQLSWSHFVELLPLKKTDARLFYAEQSASENWGIEGEGFIKYWQSSQYSVTLIMAKAKKNSRITRTYLTKRRLASAARTGIRIAAANTMKVMGYTVVAHEGWVVKKYADGNIEKIEPLANQEENANINLD